MTVQYSNGPKIKINSVIMWTLLIAHHQLSRKGDFAVLGIAIKWSHAPAGLESRAHHVHASAASLFMHLSLASSLWKSCSRRRSPHDKSREQCVRRLCARPHAAPYVCEKTAMNAFTVTQSPLSPFLYAAEISQCYFSANFGPENSRLLINVPLLSLDKRGAPRTLGGYSWSVIRTEESSLLRQGLCFIARA